MASHILWSQEEERVMALLPLLSPFIPPETPARRATLPTARVDFPASAHSTDRPSSALACTDLHRVLFRVKVASSRCHELSM